jgi:uncharacterized membrane protein YdjX (TVP38/TMEM64 family)
MLTFRRRSAFLFASAAACATARSISSSFAFLAPTTIVVRHHHHRRGIDRPIHGGPSSLFSSSSSIGGGGGGGRRRVIPVIPAPHRVVDVVVAAVGRGRTAGGWRPSSDDNNIIVVAGGEDDRIRRNDDRARRMRDLAAPQSSSSTILLAAMISIVVIIAAIVVFVVVPSPCLAASISDATNTRRRRGDPKAVLFSLIDGLSHSGIKGMSTYLLGFTLWTMTVGATTPVEIAAGMAFPLRIAIALSASGKIGGAFLQYALSKYLFSDYARVRMKGNAWMDKIDNSFESHPYRVALIWRFSPMPEFVKNVGPSLVSGLRTRYQLFATITHGLPFTVLWSCMGNEAAIVARGVSGCGWLVWAFCFLAFCSGALRSTDDDSNIIFSLSLSLSLSLSSPCRTNVS